MSAVCWICEKPTESYFSSPFGYYVCHRCGGNVASLIAESLVIEDGGEELAETLAVLFGNRDILEETLPEKIIQKVWETP